MRRLRTLRPWAGLILVLLAALCASAPALAHPQILALEPAPGARLEAAPARVRVLFNEPISTLSTIQLLDSLGRQVGPSGAPAPANLALLELAPPPLAPGVYTAAWSIIGVDGHLLKGNFAFTLLGPGGAEPGPPEAASQAQAGLPAPAADPASVTLHAPPSPLAVALRGAMLVGAAGAVGGWVFMICLLLPALAAVRLAPGPGLLRAWRRWTAALLALLLAAALLMLLVYTGEVIGRLDLAAVPVVVRDTRYGLLLVARAFLAVALLVLLAALRAASPAAGWRGASELFPLAGMLLLTFSVAGHATAQPEPLIPVVADWLHLGAAAVWLGGLALFALLLPGQLRATPAEERAPLLARLFTRFSTLALASVALLTLTGVYAATRELRGPAELWQTSYGQALLVKLSIFGGLLAFGAYHLLVARPRLAGRAATAAGWQRRVGLTLRAEAGLALLAVLAAAALTSLPPPAALQLPAGLGAGAPPSEPEAPPAYRRFYEALAAADLLVGLDVDPARVGENRFTLTVTDGGGRSLDTVQLVRLSFERPDLDIGTTELEAEPQGDDTYIASGTVLSVVGEWQVRVLVRRSDADDVEATFSLPVAE